MSCHRNADSGAAPGLGFFTMKGYTFFTCHLESAVDFTSL